MPILGVVATRHVMSCLGVHFALTEKEVARLRSLDDEQARLEHLQEVIEEHYLNHEKHFTAESDKAWDAMHRVLADGQLSWNGGAYPLNHTVLAGELLYTDSDYIMSLKSPQQVRDIAGALPAITEAEATVNIRGNWPRVFVRPDEMLRLIQNLLGNAAKFRIAGRRPELPKPWNSRRPVERGASSVPAPVMSCLMPPPLARPPDESDAGGTTPLA